MSIPTSDIRIAIIDDHEAIREGIAGWCGRATPPITVHAVYSNPAAFDADRRVREAANLSAVVLDLQYGQHLPDLRPLESIVNRGYRVIVYSQHSDPGLVLACLDRGAVSYLSKAEGKNYLTTALHAAALDRTFVSPTMAKAMAADQTAHRPQLSGRELEVLRSWFKTESKSLVAQELYISSATVSTHLARVRAKYASAGRPASTKAALVARAIQDGLVSPEEL